MVYHKKTKRSAPKGKARSKVGARKGKRTQNTKVNATLRVATNGILSIGSAPTGTTGVLNYCLGYVTALGPFGSNGSSFFNNADFIAQKSLYDEVCIKSYTIKFMPVVSQTNLYDQGYVVPTANQLILQPNLYTWFDRDASPLTAVSSSLVNKLAQYDSFKRHNCFKPWSRTMKMKPIWLACDGVAGGSHVSQEATIPLTQAGLLGNFGIYGQNLPWGGAISAANEVYGQIQVSWNFAFRGKRPVSTSVDENGVITLTPASLFAPIAPTHSFPPTNDVDGQLLTLDASGNPVFVFPGGPPTTTTTTVGE